MLRHSALLSPSILGDKLQEHCLLLLRTHSKSLKFAFGQPDISKQASSVFVKVQIRFRLDVKDAWLALHQTGQRSELREEILQ